MRSILELVRRPARRSVGRLAAVSALATLVAVEGCVLPVPYTERGSPPVSGVLTDESGVAVPGLHVTVSNRRSDRACAAAAAGAVTDAAGRFQLDETWIHGRGILIVPPVERFANGWALCAPGAAARRAADTLPRAVYHGYVALHADSVPTAEVSCLRWYAAAVPRLSCSSVDDRRVVTGGAWSEGSASGTYRVIRVDERRPAPARPRPSRWHRVMCGVRGAPDGRVFVQWVADRGDASGARVVRTAEAPIGDGLEALLAVRLEPAVEASTVVVTGVRRTCMRADARATLAFTLGAPGEIGPAGER